VPGNHENFGLIRSRWNIPRTHPFHGRGMYRHHLGPDYYSFTWGGVHFVGLNSVSMDDFAYCGYVDCVQMAWLERDLAQIPRTMPAVTFNHIPLVSGWETLIGYLDFPPVSSVGRFTGKLTFRHTVSNVVQSTDVLSGRPYPLALGAHVHAGERLVDETVGRKTRFEQCVAIVGPGRLRTLTFPSGFTLYTLRNGEIDAGRFIPLIMEGSTAP
jgi:hypothetical protein